MAVVPHRRRHEHDLQIVRLFNAARAEREQLRLGRSDVLRVTLREQAKFEAEIYEIGSRQDFWRAESDLRAADASLGPESCGFPDTLQLNCP